MKGCIIVNGYYHSASEKYRCEKIKKVFSDRGITVDVLENNFPMTKTVFKEYSFCLFFDKDYHLSKFIENCNVRVFNTTEVLKKTDNKAETYLALMGKGVEMPATVPAPKKYFYAQDRCYSDAVSSLLGYPFVMKEACGSLGKQVYLIRDAEEFDRIDRETGTVDKIYQEFRPQSFGKSVRIICIGQRAIGAMELSSEGDFRSNAHLGGKGEIFPLTEEYKNAAEKVASVLGADYVGIDFFADKPILIEVNGSAYFDQFEQVTGVDVAKEYVDYILESLSPCVGIK